MRAANGRLPADSLVLSTRNIWGIIRSQKDLNLPAHKVRGYGVAALGFTSYRMRQERLLPGDLERRQCLHTGSIAGGAMHVCCEPLPGLVVLSRCLRRCAASAAALCVQVMVANIRCNEIKLEQLRNFSQDQAWQALEAGSSSSLMRDFGKHAAGLLESCLEG